MKRKHEQLVRDLFFVAVSIGLAIYIVQTGTAAHWVTALEELQYVGIFIAGMLFTSIFTTAPAIVVLGELSQTNSIVLVTLVGAAGAMAGDYLIFRLIRDHILDDINYVLAKSGVRRWPAIFSTELFHYLLPFVGALIIASPLPDELGLTLLGISKMRDRYFLPLSFVMNALGIIGIAIVANALAW